MHCFETHKRNRRLSSMSGGPMWQGWTIFSCFPKLWPLNILIFSLSISPTKSSSGSQKNLHKILCKFLTQVLLNVCILPRTGHNLVLRPFLTYEPNLQRHKASADSHSAHSFCPPTSFLLTVCKTKIYSCVVKYLYLDLEKGEMINFNMIFT